MGIKLTVEFDNMADALDFMQGQLEPVTKAAPKKAKAAKNKPAAATATAAPTPVEATPSPVRAPAAAGPSTPDVSDAGFKAWIKANGTPQNLPTLQGLLQQFGVNKGSELSAEQRVQFIQQFEGPGS